MKELISKSKAIVTALCVNLFIAIMKFAVAFFSGSASMLSEGIHSCADTLNQVVLLVGKRQANRPPDERHPFGYSRVSFFASFCVAALLFFVGGAYSLMEAVEKLGHLSSGSVAHEQSSFIIAAAILAVSVILEGISLRTALQEVKEQQERDGTRKGIVNFFKDTRNSALIVVMTEDLAALLGLLLALFGVVLTILTGNLVFDAIGGAAIGLLLIVAAFILGKETASLIIGEALPKETVTRIEALASAAPGAVGCKMVKTVAIGTDSVLVEVDVAFPDDGSVSADEVLRSIAGIKQGIREMLAGEADFINTCVEPVTPRSEPDRVG
jgi:cation diffusion facilitator family transporter